MLCTWYTPLSYLYDNWAVNIASDTLGSTRTRMCGLTAIFYTDDCQPPSPDKLTSLLEASLTSIKHRGPDSRGLFVASNSRVGEQDLNLFSPF
jgi:hypothetical protein